MPVYPGLNTQFIGILESQGVWTEKCSGCGNCRLAEFAGILPDHSLRQALVQWPLCRIARRQGEVSEDRDCAWQLIYDRAKALGILDQFDAIAAPQDWSSGLDGGPRKVVREDQRNRWPGPKPSVSCG